MSKTYGSEIALGLALLSLLLARGGDSSEKILWSISAVIWLVISALRLIRGK